MSRKSWLALLTVSVLLLAGGGAGILAASRSGDIGTVQVAELPGADPAVRAAASAGLSPAEVSRDDPADRNVNPRAAVVPTVPDVGRRPTGLEVGRRPAGPGAAQAGPATIPTRLQVDSVGLDAPLDPVGVRDDGLMEIPDDGDRAGWYEHGAAPGDDEGSAVLAGHVDTQEGLGAMATLNDVELGARVEVRLADGSTLLYEVVGRETVEKDALPVDEIFDRTGPERLTLVTCGGPWRSGVSSYRDNVVVVALPVER